MMNVLYFVLYLLAAVCFAASASGAVVRRVNLVALGLFLWVLVPLLQTLRTL